MTSSVDSGSIPTEEHGDNAPLRKPKSLRIEKLPLADMLKNPHVQELFGQVLEGSEFQRNQSKEIASLRSELQTVNAELTLLRSRSPLRASGSGMRGNSLMPGDSASQVRNSKITPPATSVVENRTSIRPEGYPLEVLWTLKDCLEFKGLVSKANKSRPKMRKCVRHLDGSTIDIGVWYAIRATARMIVNRDLLTLPPAPPPAKPDASKTKKYFKNYHVRQWYAAVIALEKAEPIVAHCAAHWKAEHILGGCLLSALDRSKSTIPRKRRRKKALASVEESSDDDGGEGEDGDDDEDDEDVDEEEDEEEDDNDDDDNNDRDDSRRPIAHSRASKKIVGTHAATRSKDTSDKNKGNKHNPSDANSSEGGPVAKKHRRNDQPAMPQNTRPRPRPKHKHKPTTSSLHEQLSQISTPKRTPSNLAPSTTSAPKEAPNGQAAQDTEPNASGSKHIEIKFIQVSSDASSLKSELVRMFPGKLPLATELLDAMSLRPDFEASQPSSDVMALLTRIENADPNSDEFSEDDSNGSWGHYQFTAGGLTCTSALLNWRSIGNTETACRLIAAALKTCKIARHVCFNRDIEVNSFLSDAYLENVIEKLWEVWTAAGGPQTRPKGKSKADQVQTRQGTRASKAIKAAATKKPPAAKKSPPAAKKSLPGAVQGPSSTAADTPGSPASQTTAQPPQPSATPSREPSDTSAGVDVDASEEELRTLFMVLQRDELNAWISDKNIAAPTKLKTKEDCVNAILSNASSKPNPAEIQAIIDKVCLIFDGSAHRVTNLKSPT
ncbi:hypothetical protein BD779DRAFT_1680501 [Infundibulicybe gibba]|nr:hypothetical protein BD779DRAFT_1680501 [Infundibulicybe gibba]